MHEDVLVQASRGKDRLFGFNRFSKFLCIVPDDLIPALSFIKRLDIMQVAYINP